MSPDHGHEIEELPLDQRTLTGEKYRRALYLVTQTSIWTTYLYFTVRLFFILTTPEATWKIWAMFIIEGLFARKLSWPLSMNYVPIDFRHVASTSKRVVGCYKLPSMHATKETEIAPRLQSTQS